MKTKLIQINWAVSFLGLMLVNDYNSLRICLLGFGWFFVASVLMIVTGLREKERK
ncbi:MAG: hypothetical protein FWF54_04505 [Candidatus Azobacteroides sp.]|jgi:hypothetical protein|nr:hypothetical protein [Candidatus Azobacteroides sp.]